MTGEGSGTPRNHMQKCMYFSEKKHCRLHDVLKGIHDAKKVENYCSRRSHAGWPEMKMACCAFHISQIIRLEATKHMRVWL